MSVGKSRDGRQLELMKTPNSNTEVKTNTHTRNLITTPADLQVAKPAYQRILLGTRGQVLLLPESIDD